MHESRHVLPDANEGLRDTGTELLPEQVSSERDQPHQAANTNASPVVAERKGRGAGLLIALVACIAVGVLVYLGIHARNAHEQQLVTTTDAVAIPIVQVTHPQGASGAAEVVLPANVTAYVDTPIYARTSGYLKRWYADIGTNVAKGQLLAVIETPELDQQVAQAQSDVKTAQSNLQIAQITANRWQKLLAKNAVSRQEADQTMSDLTARESALAAQQANVARLQQMQDFEHVVAPFAGIVTARNVDVGSLIEQGQNSTQKELFHLAATDRLRLFVPVPEVDQEAVRDGERVEITLDAFPDQKFYGTLARSSHAVDPMSRTLNVEVDVNNTSAKLLPGAYAFVHLALPTNLQALRVPSNALLFRSQGTQVGVVQNGRIALRQVRIGHDYGATIQILEGIQPTDLVVLDPSDSLESGDRVRVQRDGSHPGSITGSASGAGESAAQ
jgi:RND family efflux transporter MFP subunit